MTRLLVSVRDAQEARVALEAGASLIDVKEPARGPLGAADPVVVRAVCWEVRGRVPVSVALGELADEAAASLARRCSGAQFAKLGLAGCASLPQWPKRWREVIRGLGANIVPVAVAYADWRLAGAPEPLEVLHYAVRFRCGGLLVDTYNKSYGCLLDYLDRGELLRLIAMCRSYSFAVVLAGSLSLSTIPLVLPLAADYLAVRGAACNGGRQDRIDSGRVGELVRLINESSQRIMAGAEHPRPFA